VHGGRKVYHGEKEVLSVSSNSQYQYFPWAVGNRPFLS
jgi:hypothetical protein